VLASLHPLPAMLPTSTTKHPFLHVFLEKRQEWARPNDHTGRRNENAAGLATVGQSTKGRTNTNPMRRILKATSL
jgi:hypothetical protein